jgi:pyrroline-5-carboxylate reductase
MSATHELWLIGAGRMGLALLEGWVAAGLVGAKAPAQLVEPKPSTGLEALVARGVARLASPPFTSRARPLIVLAVKPQILHGALKELAPLAERGADVLSIVAGRTVDFIRAGLGAPGGLEVVRVMPNTPAAIGKGISTVFAGPGVGPDLRARAEQLLSAVGAVVWVEREDLIDAGTAISGSGPAYFFLLVEALADVGTGVGLPRDVAERLARETLIGSGALLAASTLTPAALRQAVTSPGGTTEAALQVLMAQDGLADLMRCAVAAALARAKELGKG